MAMHAGMGISKIVFIAGAGYTGTILMKNGKLSEILAELERVVREKSSNPEVDSDYNDAMKDQVRRLTQEVRRLLSERQITVYGNSGQSNLLSLAGPAAALGAVGYGYMWWKGVSFSDLMYVTKRSMATAVESLTKNLENVSEALAAAKKHLTQRIENLDGKLDEQVEISKLIRNEVNNVSGSISGLEYSLEELNGLLSHYGGKLLTLEQKMDYSNAGIHLLVDYAKSGKAPMDLQEKLTLRAQQQEQLRLATAQQQGLNFLLTDGNEQGAADQLNKPITRVGSIKC